MNETIQACNLTQQRIRLQYSSDSGADEEALDDERQEGGGGGEEERRKEGDRRAGEHWDAAADEPTESDAREGRAAEHSREAHLRDAHWVVKLNTRSKLFLLKYAN